MRRLLAAGIACLALAAFAKAPAGTPVAFVADIHGNVTIEGNGKLGFLSELTPGTRLLLGSNASVSVTYAATGAEFTATGPGEVLVTPAEVKAEKGPALKRRNVPLVTDANAMARLSQMATASLRMRGITPATRSALQYPVDTAVSTLQPVARWVADAQHPFTVTVTDDAGRQVWQGEAKPDTKLPVRLSAATRYKWTVMTPNGTVGEARFETLSSEAIARAERARAAAKTFADRVVHAVVLQEIGARQEAREAWAALARERPDLPELAALAR